MKKYIGSLMSFWLSVTLISLYAQVPKEWHHLDLEKDTVFGISTIRAYEELLKGRESKPVIVAVIDSGTDTAHEDLKEVLWLNPDEKPGNGNDDDNNGYVDDVNGWSFIGGRGGNVSYDNLEITRLYRMLKPKYENVQGKKVKDKKEYKKWLKVKSDYEARISEHQAHAQTYRNLLRSVKKIQSSVGKEEITPEDIQKVKLENEWDSIAANNLRIFSAFGGAPLFIQILNGALEEQEKQLRYYLNVDFDPRYLVGDDYNNANERHYGITDVMGPDASHGTHVSGIIGAIRGNGTGMDGIANNIQIMVLRVVPDGDERDKDVANAIRYAVDNGAKVINMSFGKGYDYNKGVVDDAVKYAASKDVLLVHAAGNDSKNNDHSDNFPNPYFLNGGRAKNWIEVGASTHFNNEKLTAEFSNYGRRRVDVFAPGQQIWSTMPGSEYADQSGTSMAAPVVAGLAALLRSYFPELTAEQVRDIIIRSVTPVKHKVNVPGTGKEITVKGNKDNEVTYKKKKLKRLCKSGGVVNAYNAVKLAIRISEGKKK